LAQFNPEKYPKPLQRNRVTISWSVSRVTFCSAISIRWSVESDKPIFATELLESLIATPTPFAPKGFEIDVVWSDR
jgi:hypothetical protein